MQVLYCNGVIAISWGFKIKTTRTRRISLCKLCTLGIFQRHVHFRGRIKILTSSFNNQALILLGSKREMIEITLFQKACSDCRRNRKLIRLGGIVVRFEFHGFIKIGKQHTNRPACKTTLSLRRNPDAIKHRICRSNNFLRQRRFNCRACKVYIAFGASLHCHRYRRCS